MNILMLNHGSVQVHILSHTAADNGVSHRPANGLQRMMLRTHHIHTSHSRELYRMTLRCIIHATVDGLFHLH